MNHSTTFTCTQCQPNQSMPMSDALSHLEHSYTKARIRELKVREVMHLDGTEFFTTVYDVLDGNFRIGQQTIRSERAADDPMRLEY